MNVLQLRKINKKTQFFVSFGFIVGVALGCFWASDFISYKMVALILLMCVSVLAMFFDILPVLVSAISSALIWNFFFIPPLFTFNIQNPEDALMFLLYFLVAMVNAVLTFQIRQAEKKAREKEEKENTIKLYNVLLNSLSHELRTPIATIIGAMDTINENKENLSELHQKELFEQIEKASLRLNRQVENLLNMSRLETDILSLKQDWCDINELIYTVILKYAHDTEHTLEFFSNENLPLFKFDRTLIEQVIQNLVHNAIIYTPKSSVIKIQVSYLSNVCQLTVSDDGKGIPENEQNLIFDKFYRLPNSKSGGSGLGLSIAKGFVEAHKGKILLEKSEEGGAKFVVEFPTEVSYLNQLKNE